MLPRRVAPLRRSFGRVVRRQYGGGRLPEPSGAAAADAEPNNWPVLAGSVLACSMVAAGIAARSDWLMKRVQACMDSPAADGTSLFQIGGLMAAFTIAQLPADDLKLRLLGSGAARSWGRLVASFEADVQQVALGAMTALLEGPAPLAAFHKSGELYQAYLDALPPVLHASPTATPLNDSELLLDALRLTAALATHPAFEHAAGDAWFYERMLEQAAPATDFDQLAGLYWSCAAAAAARRRDVARGMLGNPTVTRYLVHLAPPAGDEPGVGSMAGSDGVPTAAGRPRLGTLSSLGEMGGAWARGGGGPADGAPGDDGAGVMVRRGSLGLTSLRRATGDTTADYREALTEDYAHLALCRLAAHAAEVEEEREAQVRRGAAAPPTDDELADWNQSFFETHAAPPDPPPPPLPPALVEELTSDERLLEGMASVAFCALGGLVWGALRGATPASRAHRTFFSAVRSTVAGAGIFEAAMLLKTSARDRLPPSLGGGRGNYSTATRLANACAVDVLVSAQLLWMLMRRLRAPFALGGWLIGRSVILISDLIDVELEFMD